MNEFRYRWAEEHDYVEVQELLGSALGTYPYYRKVSGDSDNIIVCSQDSEIVGAVIIKEGMDCECPFSLDGIAVAVEHRQKGIATELIRRAVQAFGVDNIVCHAWATRGKVRLYTPLVRNQFEKIATLEDFWRKVGGCKECAEKDICTKGRVCDNHIFIRFSYKGGEHE